MQLENWEDTIVPGNFVHSKFMFKNSEKYHKIYGWGWARWLGLNQEPFNDGADSCISCHKPVKRRDWVFTELAVLPK